MMREGWSNNKIIELIESIFSGGTPSTQKSEYWGGDLNWLSSGETRNNFIYETEKTITQLGAKESSTKLAKKGDILIASAGQGFTRGQTSYLMKDSYINQSIIGIRTNPEKLYSLFLFYTLKSKYKLMRDLSDSNSSRGSLTCRLVENLDIRYPESIKEQQKIATILSNYDDLLENNIKRIELLEKIAKLVYDEWFVKFKFPGHETVKMVDSELGKIPEGWEIVTLESKFNIVLGGTPSRNKKEYWDGEINWINSGKVNDLRIIERSEGITELGLKKSSTKIMPKRTTVLAITGATLGQVSLTEIETGANQSVVGIYDESNFYSSFIYLKINEIIQEMISKAGGGAQQHINKDIVKGTKILLPNDSIIKLFNDFINPLFNLLSDLLFKNKNLEKTRDLLLPKLITGDVDVSMLDVEISEVEA